MEITSENISTFFNMKQIYVVHKTIQTFEVYYTSFANITVAMKVPLLDVWSNFTVVQNEVLFSKIGSRITKFQAHLYYF